jgi:hypothetical protein
MEQSGQQGLAIFSSGYTLVRVLNQTTAPITWSVGKSPEGTTSADASISNPQVTRRLAALPWFIATASPNLALAMRRVTECRLATWPRVLPQPCVRCHAINAPNKRVRDRDGMAG